MNILGIETSCDETAASIVTDGRIVRSNIIWSQADLHKLFGGVVPEIAARKHVEAIVPTVRQALSEAEMTLDDVDAIAVTAGPGLIGALLTGVSYAKGLAKASGLPLIPVHHITGHVAANYIQFPELEPPFVCLIASGGHSHIVYVEDYASFSILARTRDDAAGEAFDKISRAIGLGYPGGPLIDKVAKFGDPHKYVFPKTTFPDGNLDFSFSGLKTAALNFINQRQLKADARDLDADTVRPEIADFCASYQYAIVNVLSERAVEACLASGSKHLALAGGVAANSALRQLLQERSAAHGIEFYVPPPVLCTDNAAMIASMAYYLEPMSDYGRLDAKASVALPVKERE